MGDLGSGKTTLCTRYIILTKLLHPDKKIYCNYALKNYSYMDLDLMDLYLNHQEEENLILGIDEIYTMIDCRVSGSYRNRIESYFMNMFRKAKVECFITMQYEKFVDWRLSAHIKVKYIMEGIPMMYKTMLNGKEYQYVKNHPYLFKVTLIDERNSNNIIVKDYIFDGRRWFKEFNTNQRILPPKDIIQKVEIAQMKQELQYNKLKNQMEELKNGNKADIKKSKHKI